MKVSVYLAVKGEKGKIGVLVQTQGGISKDTEKRNSLTSMGICSGFG